MMDPGVPGHVVPRGFLRVGGATLAQHQLSIARRLGCQRLICLARGTSPDVIALQHDAELAGMKFHIIANAQDLSALVTAADELVVVAEGLLVDPDEAVERLEGGPVVLVQPAEGTVEAGFERIDFDHAWAGLLIVPGHLVESLHELPADCDVPSSLCRIALQSGVRIREVPATSRAGIRWRMIGSETEAYAAEHEWLRQQVGQRRRLAPGMALARQGVLWLGSSLLHSGSASKTAAASALAVLAFSLGAGWLGANVLGFVLCAIAWILAQALHLLRNIERRTSGLVDPAISRADALAVSCDVVIVALAAWGAAREAEDTAISMLFAPVMLLLVARVVPRIVGEEFSSWVRDRATLALILAGASALGLLYPAVQLIAVALAVIAIAVPPDNRG